MPSVTPDPLRFTTWLAPGLPVELFETVAEHVSSGLGVDYQLSVESKLSGPLSVEDDRFATGRTDVGFLCPPAYLWLIARPEPSVALVPFAPVYDDPRNQGRPVYVSDVVVRADSGIGSFAELAGRRVGFNEPASLSGFVSVLAHLESVGLDPGYFGEFVQVGSHRRALELIGTGELDAAAIDANVWQAWRAEHPEAAVSLVSVDSLGPHPVQPIVARASAGPELVDAVAEELCRPAIAAALDPFGITGFGPVTSADYESLGPIVTRALRWRSA